MIGHRDSEFLEPHREAIQHLKNARLEIVPGATHFFQEPGALRAVARLTNDWFEQHLCRPDPSLHARGNDLVLGPSTS